MTDIYEQLQTEADVEAEKIRPTKEESSLYGAKWLTVEDLLTDDKGYSKFAVDSAKAGGGGESNALVCDVTYLNVGESEANVEISPGDGQFCLDNNGALITNSVTFNPNTPVVLKFIPVAAEHEGQTYYIVGGQGMFNGDSEDYSSVLSNLNNINVLITPNEGPQGGIVGYTYVPIITDITKPSSFTYTFNWD